MNGKDIQTFLMWGINFRPRDNGDVECTASQNFDIKNGHITVHHTIYAANINTALAQLKKQAKVIMPLHVGEKSK